MIETARAPQLFSAGRTCGMAFLAWQGLCLVSWGVDALMIFIGVQSGGSFLLIFAIGFSIKLVVFLATLLLYDWLQSTMDIDILSLEKIKQTRCGHWVADKGALWTFWIGSIHVFEPDIVTLLLREKSGFCWRDVRCILIPATFWNVAYWSIFWHAGAASIHYFSS